MGGAMLLALLKSAAVPPEDILLIESDGEKLQKLGNATGCNTQVEIDYYRNGGVLHTVLRRMLRDG